MKAEILDLMTGMRAWLKCDVSAWDITEGNWSCDCNRADAFDAMTEGGYCDGCVRYRVAAVVGDLEGWGLDELLAEANRGYQAAGE